jgi:diguanylate cyclase (GGDEF)-like protein
MVSAVRNKAGSNVLRVAATQTTPEERTTIDGLREELVRLQSRFDEMRARLEEVLRAADQDMLLPVLNRRALIREITRFIDFTERYGTRSSLLFLDINGFKTINDRFGHPAGDSILHQFCESLSSNIRASDILGRLGGDEFGIILPGMSAQQALRKGETLLQCLRDHPPAWADSPVPLTFACGACELRPGMNAGVALAEADRVMYDAKRRVTR